MLPLAALLAITVVVFSRSFGSGYVSWDDDRLVAQNPALQDGLADALPAFFGGFVEGDYIPLPLLSFWVEGRILGHHPAVHHAVNLALHLIGICLLSAWLRRMGLGTAARLFVLLVFAVHPLQVEPVLWISERKSLLNAPLVFAAMILFDRSRGSRRPAPWLAAYVTAFALSCLCKTTAILLPVLLLALDAAREGRVTLRMTLAQAPAIVVAGCLAAVRMAALHTVAGSYIDATWTADRLVDVPVMALTACGHYLASFFVPVGLSPIYPLFRQTGSRGLLALLAVAAFSLAVLMTLRRRDPRSLFFALWFALLLAPVLNLVPRGNFVNDRYMYLPLIGLAALVAIAIETVAAGWERLRSARWLQWASLAVMAAVLGSASFAASSAWEDGLHLWESAVRANALSQTAWNNLAMERLDRGDVTGAREALRQGLEIGHDGVTPVSVLYNNMGRTFIERRYADPPEPDRAMPFFRKAIETATRPQDGFAARQGIATTLLEGGRKAEAAQVLEGLVDDMGRAGLTTQGVRALLETCRP